MAGLCPAATNFRQTTKQHAQRKRNKTTNTTKKQTQKNNNIKFNVLDLNQFQRPGFARPLQTSSRQQNNARNESATKQQTQQKSKRKKITKKIVY